MNQIVRTSKGDKWLVTLTTDPDGSEAMAIIREARAKSPQLAKQPDHVVVDVLIHIICSTPQPQKAA